MLILILILLISNCCVIILCLSRTELLTLKLISRTQLFFDHLERELIDLKVEMMSKLIIGRDA